MQYFIDIETNQYNLTEAEIRAANPNTLFKTPFSSPRYLPIAVSPQPAFDRLTHDIREKPPVNINGLWTQVWEVYPLPAKIAQERAVEAVEELKSLVVNSTQARLDAFAATRGYDGTDSISKYQNITDQQISTLATQALRDQVTKFRAECQYLAIMAAATWATLYSIMDQVLSGDRSMPSGYEEIEADLPPLAWPV